MGNAISWGWTILQTLWELVFPRHEFGFTTADAHAISLARAASATTALKAMPDLLTARPWRTCTDRGGKVWSIHNPGSGSPATTHTTQLAVRDADAIASEAVTGAPWIAVDLADVLPPAGGGPLRGFYNVPWLETWANEGTHTSAQNDALMAELLAANKGLEGDKVEKTQVDGVMMQKLNETGAAGMERAEKHYRTVMNVKPGVFKLSKAGQNGATRLECPKGFGGGLHVAEA